MNEEKYIGLEAKVVRLESAVEGLMEAQKEMRREYDALSSQTQKLITSIALLDQSVRDLTSKNIDRKLAVERISMFVIGGFIAAVVSWVIRGGLAP